MNKELLIPEKTNLLINDTRIPTDKVREAFGGSVEAKVNFLVLDALEMSIPLELALNEFLQTADLTKLAIICPGNGSKAVMKCLGKETCNIIRQTPVLIKPIPCRVFNNGRARLENSGVTHKMIKGLNNKGVNNAVIIDDVVASGETVMSVKRSITNGLAELEPEDKDYDPYSRFSFPSSKGKRIDFSVFTWLKQASAKLDYIEVTSTITYSRRDGRVPLNSISTLLGKSSKSEDVKKSYSAKYFNDPDELSDILDKIK